MIMLRVMWIISGNLAILRCDMNILDNKSACIPNEIKGVLHMKVTTIKERNFDHDLAMLNYFQDEFKELCENKFTISNQKIIENSGFLAF